MEAEIIHVQRKGTVIILPHELPNFIDVAGCAIRRHAHHLVLALVDLEAEKCGEGAVEEAEGMRKVDLLGETDLIVASHTRGSRGPFADAVHGENRRF